MPGNKDQPIPDPMQIMKYNIEGSSEEQKVTTFKAIKLTLCLYFIISLAS